MSAIPLEVERRFEQRWVARFFLPNKSSGQHSQRPKRTQLTSPALAGERGDPPPATPRHGHDLRERLLPRPQASRTSAVRSYSP